MSLPNSNSRLRSIIESALLEDAGMGDITTDAVVPSNLLGQGEIRVKEDGIIAGLEVAEAVFHVVDPRIKFQLLIADGSSVKAGSIAGIVDGPFGSILKGERTVLNILQRMSGIATLTRMYVDAVKGTNAKITDTRKTVPGLRILDKMAVRIAGGTNHRFGLDDMVLIKDNHVAAAGGIKAAIEHCISYLREKRLKLQIEVETKNIEEVKEALLHSGIDRIMLDNFSIDEMRNAVTLIGHAVEVEASGNVTLDKVRAIAETGVDFISVGALTHSPRALDISLKVTHRHPSR
jgi:nicotinate-nucleotide pyrophosphorylase (carboxylating)